MNSAKSGRFSTDRTIQEYNRDIWRLNQTSIPSEIEDV
ncbi:MAG: glycogen/starch/alpha-glucan phosphorylase [Candidatus Thiodiazotropha sp.]